MPWLVGIDEAGYGPNLGPFVMASTACQVSRDPAKTDLWKLLKKVTRRKKDKADGRLLIADSKQVYSTTKGLKELERGVLASCDGLDTSLTLADWLGKLSATAAKSLDDECWYTGTTELPVTADADDVKHARERFQNTCEKSKIQWARTRCVVVCPPRFNGVLDRWGSKSIVLMLALAELLQHNCAGDDGEAMYVFIDKHGGRNSYTAVLQQSLPEGTVIAEEEGPECSRYRIEGLRRDIHLTFQPRADVEHFGVALASMSAKYLRELLMHEFNAYWQRLVPDLKPTAGYPGDAARFMEAIRETARQQGLNDDQIWRRK